VSRARDRITLEDYSRNTVENAVYSKAIVPKPGERWLLVTSAYHMPRAIAVFRKAGFPVEPVQSIGAHVASKMHYTHLRPCLTGRSSELFPVAAREDR
jgi:uncharacterized SAM-binding protein YcdF (DUF218 family)